MTREYVSPAERAYLAYAEEMGIEPEWSGLSGQEKMAWHRGSMEAYRYWNLNLSSAYQRARNRPGRNWSVMEVSEAVAEVVKAHESGCASTQPLEDATRALLEILKS